MPQILVFREVRDKRVPGVVRQLISEFIQVERKLSAEVI